MIESIEVIKLSDSSFPWTDKVEYLKSNTLTKFKPGLNIVYGPNGSGKSTVIQMLSMGMAAQQGGVSVVTQSWLNDISNFKKVSTFPAKLVHDGRPVLYYDARQKVGLISGGFDDDFFSAGLANTMSRGSTGQLGFQRMDRMLCVLLDKDDQSASAQKSDEKKKDIHSGRKPRTAKSFERKPSNTPLKLDRGFPSEIDWRLKKSQTNSHWTPILEMAEEMLEPKCDPGPKTLIFDEPESGFSLPWQEGLWNNIFSKVDPAKFQLIVATHSPFALGIPGANYIEMEPGYIRQSMDSLERVASRIRSLK